MKKILFEIKYFFLTHDDIELFTVGSLLATIFAFFIYCIWSLLT